MTNDRVVEILKAIIFDSPELDKENGELISNKRTETHACDLIDRQAVIDEINKHSVLLEYHVPHTFHELKDAIKHLPSAQPERKTGKWIKHIDDLFPAESTIECSECHHEQPLTIDSNFCPNCGERMEGE